MSASLITSEDDTTSEATTTIGAHEQRQKLKSLSLNRIDNENGINSNKDRDEDTAMMAILTLQDITEIPPANSSLDFENDAYQSTTIPKVKFIDDISHYILSFTPKIVTAELLIGAYTQLHTKYKLSETSLLRKQEHLKEKVPELEKSLSLVQSLIEKQENQITNGTVRYNLVDSIYAKAEIDYTVGIVYLWLGANVMLEYTYDEAIHFLRTNYTRAATELQHVNVDLSFIRDQIVTTEVNISRIYNWDVRQKRNVTIPTTSSLNTKSV